MPCQVEKLIYDRGPGGYWWYCCFCGDGPFNCALTGKCFCGHEILGCATVCAQAVYASDYWHTCSKPDFGAPSQTNREKASANKRFPLAPEFDSQFQFVTTEGLLKDDFNAEILGNNTTSTRSPAETRGFGTFSDREVAPTEPKINSDEISFSPTGSTTSYETERSCSTCESTPDPSDGEDEIQAAIATQARHLTIRILETLYLVYDATSENFVCTTSGDTSTASSSLGRNLGTNSSTKSSKDCGSKRTLRNQEGANEDNEDDEDNDRRKRRTQPTLPPDYPEGSEPKYACPFLKYNPGKYRFSRSCIGKGPGWSRMHRLKEHLYRRHRLYHCQRCYDTFDEEPALIAHSREEQGCDKREQNPEHVLEGIDSGKLALLKRRTGLKDLNDVEHWKAVYRILFGSTIVQTPSPFFDSSELKEENFLVPPDERHARLINHWLRVLPNQLSTRVATVFQQHRSSLTETGAQNSAALFESLESSTMNCIQTTFDQVISDLENQSRRTQIPTGPQHVAEPNHELDAFSSFPVPSSPFIGHGSTNWKPTLTMGQLDFTPAFSAWMEMPLNETVSPQAPSMPDLVGSTLTDHFYDVLSRPTNSTLSPYTLEFQDTSQSLQHPFLSDNAGTQFGTYEREAPFRQSVGHQDDSRSRILFATKLMDHIESTENESFLDPGDLFKEGNPTQVFESAANITMDAESLEGPRVEDLDFGSIG